MSAEVETPSESKARARYNFATVVGIAIGVTIGFAAHSVIVAAVGSVIGVVVCFCVLALFRVQPPSDKKLARCRSCENPVSRQAETCPHCGVKDPGLTGVARELKGIERWFSRVIRFALLLAVGLAITGFATNPTNDSFQSFLKDQYHQQGNDLDALVNQLTVSTNYKSWYLFSAATAHNSLNSKTACYIGVLGKWVPVKVVDDAAQPTAR